MPLKTQIDEQPSLNLTPMIDVVFLLIIFFMAASRFSEDEHSIELQLPEVAQGNDRPTAPPQVVDVAIQANGQIVLDGQPVTLEEFRSRLLEARSGNSAPTAIVRGDRACPYQHIAAALAVCQEVGITNLSVSVQVEVAQRHSP